MCTFCGIWFCVAVYASSISLMIYRFVRKGYLDDEDWFLPMRPFRWAILLVLCIVSLTRIIFGFDTGDFLPGCESDLGRGGSMGLCGH